MGFWIFMLIMELLLPFTMIGFGKYFIKNAPKKINSLFGYRTSMSMKNRETWNFAHTYFGRLWYVLGIFLLPVTVTVMIIVIGESQDAIGLTGVVLLCIQMLSLTGAIIATENALKKKFNLNGRKR